MKAGRSGVADTLSDGSRRDLRHEAPDVASPEEQENQGEQCQQGSCHDLGDGARRRQGAAGQLLLVVSYRLDRSVAEMVDLVRSKMQRSTNQPLPSRVDTAGHLVRQLR